MQYQTRAVVPGRFYGIRMILYPVGVVGAAIGFVAVLVGGSLFFTCGGAYE